MGGWIGFASIHKKILYAYKPSFDDNTIDMLTWIPFAIFVPFSFLSMWVIENRGVKFSIRVGVSIQMVGYWFWGFLNHSVPLMILGVTLIAISQPFIVNIPTKLSACSFPKKDRVISTMIGVISGSMGCLLGYFLPMIFVPAQPWKEEDNSKSDQDAKMNIQ
jgi:hypothetical protein